MIQKIIKLSDYPLLSKLLTTGKTIIASNRNNYWIYLNQIKGKQIIYTNEIEAIKELGYRENTIEIDFDTKEHEFFKLWNGTDGDKGVVGDKGPKGDQGEPYNVREMELRGYTPLPIINNDTTDDDKSIWSAYRGKIMEDFLKSISEIFMTDNEYQLLFNENEKDEYENINEYHQIFIDMEFITTEDNHGSALVHTDTKEYKTYIKYWTYEDENVVSYFKNIGTEESPIYEEQINFDLWNDLYLNSENTDTYYTRKLVTTSIDPLTGEVLTSEFVYTPVEVPIWLDLEFTTDIEDTKSILLSAVDGTDDGDVSKEEQEEEIIILYRAIRSISVEGNKEITIPINSIVTKIINIQPSDYINAYIDIEYDENYIKVFEDGRIMALNNPCPEGTTIKLSAVNKDEITGEYQKSNYIFDTLTIKVVIYVENILFDNYHIEGLKGVKYDLLPKNSDLVTENKKIYYEIYPNNASNKSIEIVLDNSENSSEFINVEYNNINEYYTIELLKEGETSFNVKACDDSRIQSMMYVTVITPINEIIVPDQINSLIGYTTPIYVQVLPDNANYKELEWNIIENEAIEAGNTITIADDHQTAQLYINNYSEEFTIRASATDGSSYYKDIRITPKVPVYDIELNMSSISIDKYDDEHDTYQLIANVTNDNADNKTLYWSSSDNSIVTVEQTGLVKAISGGTATITVKATDGSIAMATCTVTSTILITSIKLPQNLKYHLGNNNYPAIIPTITPVIANNSLIWYTSDDSIATIDNNGKLNLIKEGKIKVYAIANDNRSVIGSTDVEITIPTNQLLLVNNELIYNDSDENDQYYELNINIDEYFTIVSIVEPDNTSNQNLKYISMNENIVSIDNNGNINALSQGTATLFIQTTDGTELSQKLKVNVI